MYFHNCIIFATLPLSIPNSPHRSSALHQTVHIERILALFCAVIGRNQSLNALLCLFVFTNIRKKVYGIETAFILEKSIYLTEQ